MRSHRRGTTSWLGEVRRDGSLVTLSHRRGIVTAIGYCSRWSHDQKGSPKARDRVDNFALIPCEMFRYQKSIFITQVACLFIQYDRYEYRDNIYTSTCMYETKKKSYILTWRKILFTKICKSFTLSIMLGMLLRGMLKGLQVAQGYIWSQSIFSCMIREFQYDIHSVWLPSFHLPFSIGPKAFTRCYCFGSLCGWHHDYSR